MSRFLTFLPFGYILVQLADVIRTFLRWLHLLEAYRECTDKREVRHEKYDQVVVILLMSISYVH